MSFNEESKENSPITLLLNLELVNGTFLLKFANDNFFKLTSEFEGNFLGSNFFKIFPGFETLKIDEIARSVLNSQEVEFKLKVFNGDKLIHIFNSVMFKTDSNNVTWIVKYNLGELINRVEDSFIDSIKAMAIFQEGGIVYANKQFADTIGVSLNKIRKFNLEEGCALAQNLDEDIVNNLNQVLSKEWMFKENSLFLKKEGKLKKLKLFFSALDYYKKPAVQINCIDVTNSNLISEKSFDAISDLKLVQNISKIATVRWKKGDVVNWSASFLDIFEIPQDQLYTIEVPIMYDIYQFVHPEDKEQVNKYMIESKKNRTDFSADFRIITASNNVKYVTTYFQREYSDDGEILSFRGYVQDITKSKIYEQKIKKNLQEKNILLSELHDRVKNNLQILLSLLNLETRFNGYDPEDTINKTKDRIRTLALTFEMSYGSEDLPHLINLKEYFEYFISDVFKKNNLESVETNLNIMDINLGFELAIPLGLIVNELLIISVKHADLGVRKNYSIDIFVSELNKNEIILTLIINGATIPNNILFNEGLQTSPFTIVYLLIDQIEGNMNIHPSLNSTTFEIIFPKNLINSDNDFVAFEDHS